MISCLSAQSLRNERLPIPTPQQAAWQDDEIGMFVHFAPNTWKDQEYDDLSVPLSQVNPSKLDTDQWARVAKSMGARSIVFVAKHVGGFCWWQTDTTEYSAKHIPWRDGKGDVMADLSKSCKKLGLKLGVYLSPADRHFGVDVGGKASDPAKQAAYQKVFRQQLTELLSRYGEIHEVWFDGSLVFDVGDILSKHAPKSVVFQGPQASIRWVGNEDGYAPDPAWNAVKFGKKPWGNYTSEDGDPSGDRWLPNECDARMRNTWFWRTDNLSTVKSVDQLMDMYEKSVGRGAVLLLNNTPDTSGRIPEADARRAAEFGAEVKRRYGRPVIDTVGSGNQVEMILSAPKTVDAVVSMEDIRKGEIVREYVVEGKVDGVWRELARGTAIGHKKIDRFQAALVSGLRLRITKSIGKAAIRSFAAYDVADSRD
jgi:alpha-L-fucosidase